jgi:RHS repeat-associated protein
MLTLPQGDYRFRSDLNGTHFWSDEMNHCTIPGCENATIVVTLPVTVTVTNTDAVPQEGLAVYVFDEVTYTGFNGTTDVNGEVSLTLPQGDYRFRSDLNGTQFWSGETNHCTIPGCLNASITVTIPMTVTVQSQTGSPYPDLPVYVFSGESYTGFNGTSDEIGQVVFTLPQGDYRFRSDYDGVQFWSGEVNHCTIPDCLEVLVEIPGGVGELLVTIDYTYDPLYRLTAADYDTGEFFHYYYDAVGNRLTQETHEETNTYAYDITNRLIEVDGVTFIWDDNGNLIQDDTRIYGYDHANRLTLVLMEGDTYNFAYNGLGDRLRQTVNGMPTSYWLDLSAGFTQVLASEEATYLYGLARIGEEQPSGWQFYLGDALGSVRQLVDVSNGVGAGMAYEPFGDDLVSTGVANSVYGFTGEWRDATELTNLRARYYSADTGRFMSRDVWEMNPLEPSSYNKWLYVQADPINGVDPTGKWQVDTTCIRDYKPGTESKSLCLLDAYQRTRVDPWEVPPELTWNPSINLPLIGDIRMQVRGAQFEVPGHWYYSTCDKDSKECTGHNFKNCGTVSLAGVLGVAANEVLNEWGACAPGCGIGSWDDTEGTDSGQLASFVNSSYGNTHYAYTFSWGPKFNAPRWVGDRLTAGEYILPLVMIQSGSRYSNVGGWLGSGVDNVPHWVVITGISVEWKWSDEGSMWNWLRTNNPFTNATEYYKWEGTTWIDENGRSEDPGFKNAWLSGAQKYRGLVIGK